MSNMTEMENLAQLVKRSAVNEIHRDFDRPFAVISEGLRVQDLGAFVAKADVTQPKFESLESLLRWTREYSSGETRIFVHRTDRGIKAITILSYHRCSGIPIPIDTSKGFDNGEYETEFSEEWMTWLVSNKKSMSHVDFASFLEENASSVATPSGARLLEMISDLELDPDVQFESSVRQGNQISFAYRQGGKVKAGGVDIPKEIRLSVPIFRHGAKHDVALHLRYRLSEGNLQLSYQIANQQATKDSALADMMEQIEKETDIKPYLGRP